LDVFKGPLLSADLATRFQDIQLGGEVTYGASSNAIESYSLGLSLDRPKEKYSMQALNGLSVVNVACFQRLSDQLETAYRASWDAKAGSLGMEVGAKLYLANGGFFKTKVDNLGRLGLALASEVNRGLVATLGASLDLNKLQEGDAHKFGIDLTYSA
jgi:voltage-dependent anion channel protein 2